MRIIGVAAILVLLLMPVQQGIVLAQSSSASSPSLEKKVQSKKADVERKSSKQVDARATGIKLSWVNFRDKITVPVDLSKGLYITDRGIHNEKELTAQSGYLYLAVKFTIENAPIGDLQKDDIVIIDSEGAKITPTIFITAAWSVPSSSLITRSSFHPSNPDEIIPCVFLIDNKMREKDLALSIPKLNMKAIIRSAADHKKPVYSVAVTPDGRKAVSGSSDKTIKIWDISRGNCLVTMKGHDELVDKVVVTPDGRNVVSSSSLDKTLKVWDIATGKCLSNLEGHTGNIRAMTLSPDGKKAVSASNDNTLKVWDIITGKCLATLKGHTGSVCSVTLTPDSKKVFSGSTDNTVKMWDIGTGECLATLTGHTGMVTALKVTPDGKKVVSASGYQDGSTKVWDIATGTCIVTMGLHYARFLVLTPDGKTAGVGGGNSVDMWDIATGKMRGMLRGHKDSINAVDLTRDGKKAVSASHDDTLKVWDVETGKCLATLNGHSDKVNSVALTPDGKKAVSASSDDLVKIWDLSSF